MSITPQEAAAAIVAEMQAQFNVNDLVEQARVKLGLGTVPRVTTDNAVRLIGDEAVAVNELVARAAELKHIADAAAAERDIIGNLLADVLGDREELYVNGAPVFTYKETTSRVLDQATIKSLHPDIPGNEQYWKTTASRRRVYK